MTDVVKEYFICLAVGGRGDIMNPSSYWRQPSSSGSERRNFWGRDLEIWTPTAFGCLEEVNFVSSTVFQHMQTFRSLANTDKSVIEVKDNAVIFYKISDLHKSHFQFIVGLSRVAEKWSVGDQEVGPIFQKFVSTFFERCTCKWTVLLLDLSFFKALFSMSFSNGL